MKLNQKSTQKLLWLCLIITPVVSTLIMAFVAGSNPLSFDAFNSQTSDARGYYWAVTQMREFGHPSGVWGYNETTSLEPSYGVYGIFVHIPYYLMSFVTGYDSHNFMYYANLLFGVMSAVFIVLILRPDTRQSIWCIALFLFHFVLTSYLFSGMAEGSYIFYAAVFSACALYIAASMQGKTTRGCIACFVVMILLTAFFSCSRPFLLAFMLVPFSLAFVTDFGSFKHGRLFFTSFTVLATLLALGAYLYCTRFYAPYFEQELFANSFSSRVVEGISKLYSENIECVTNTFERLVKLKPRGIMVTTYFLCSIIILAMAIKSARRGNLLAAAYLASLLICGFIMYEAQLVIYTYLQMHRMLIPTIVVFLLTIIWFGGSQIKGIKISIRSIVIVCVCVMCVGGLVFHRADYRLPEQSDVYENVDDLEMREHLSILMPKSSDNEWDNTIAREMEQGSMWLYYDMPRHLTVNICRSDYLEQAISNKSFKSKYLSLRLDSDLNKAAAKTFPLIYEDATHKIYQVRS